MEKKISIAAFSILLLNAFVLGIKNLGEPDLFWMLRTGEWMISNMEVVKYDPFSFTFSKVDWINVKWLFEVIIYAVSKAFGQEFILMIQAITNVGMVYFSFKTFKNISSKKALPSLLPAFAIAIYIALIGINYRVTGRPEMMSHFFSIFFIWVYSEFKNGNFKYIFLWIPAMALWVNLHEAYGTGYAIMFICTFGFVLDSYFTHSIASISKKGNNYIFIAFIASVLATSISPRNFQMILHPFEIFGQLNVNQFTTELYSYKTEHYWEQFESYLAIVILLISCSFLIVKTFQTKAKSLASKIATGIGFHSLGILAAFFYLALTAHRNIAFFILLAIPFTALFFQLIFNHLSKNKTAFYRLNLSFVLIGVLFYFLIVSNSLYTILNANHYYGLRLTPVKEAVASAEYIKTNNLEGKVYTDYLVSSYLLWDLRPNFKTFIDLRDLDVFPEFFFQDFLKTSIYPPLFEKVDAQYTFNYIVLYRQQFARLHKYLYNSSNWHLVNIDPVSAIYVRDTTTNNALINKAKEMDGDVFIKAPFVKANLPSTIVSKIFNPLYNENNNVPYYDVDIYASDYYSSVGNFNLSEKRLIQALQANNTNYEAIEKLGYNYINKAIVAEDENSKTSLLNKAIEAFQNGINVNPTMPEFYIGIGLSYMQQGKVYDAIPYFTKANDVKPTTKAYNTLADCQNYLMQIDPQNTNTYVRNWFKYMEQSYKLDTKDLLIRYRLGVSYCQRNECDKAKKYIKNHPGGDDFTQEELKQLLTCKDKCGF